MRNVLRAVGERLGYGIPVIILVTFGAVALVDFMPGSPGRTILGDMAPQAQVEVLNERYGYNEPVPERYWDWATSAVQGNFGETLFTGDPVLPLVLDRLAVTAELALLALIIALLVAIPLALYTSVRPDGAVARSAQVVTSGLLSVPSFVAVIIVSLLFTAWLGWFPATGWQGPSEGVLANLQYAALPALALSTYEIAFFYRVLRAELSGTLREDFVLVARAKGLSRPYILLRHVLRPSLGSFITVLGLTIGRILGGAVIVENFFAVPGIGAEVISAVSEKDIGVLQAIVAIAVVLYVVIFMLVDLAYAWIDPRVSVR